MKVLVILNLFFWTFHAQARWMTLKEAGAVIEKYEMSFDVQKDGSSIQTLDYLARVQGEDAKTSISLFNIEYNPLVEDVKIVSAYTQNGKEKIPVDPSAIEDRDKGESKDYDAIKVRSVVFPQVQIGSKVFVRYTVHTKKALVEGRWSNDIYLEPGIFVEKFKVSIKSALPLHYDVLDTRGWLKVHQSDKFHLAIENRKMIQGSVVGEKESYFHPAGFSHVWVSSETSWDKFFSVVDEDFTKVLGADIPPKLKPVIAEASKAPTNKDKIFKLMNYISRDFRYFGDWRRHNGGIVPRSLKEIEKTRYGDCKDLASLLTVMLRQLKIEANVALVRRGDNPWGHEPDYKLPVIAHFNHAIVEAKADGETYWLDATNPVASLKPMPDIAGRPAWILSGAKSAHFDRLPDAKSDAYLHVHDREISFPSRETVKIKLKADLKDMAPSQTANQLLLQPRSDVLTNIYEYFADGQEVRSYKFTEEPEASRILKDLHIGLEYEAERITFEAGKDSFFVFPDKIMTGAFYETADRESDIRLSYEPFHMLSTRRLKKTKLAQTPPAPCHVHSQWLDADRTVEVQGDDVVVHDDFNVIQPYITHEEYGSSAFRKLQSETKKCLYRSGILIDSSKH